MSQVALKEKIETPTQQQSLTLMRNLLRASLSCICYLRNLFDEHCFMDKNLSGISIKALLPSTEESSLLCQWIEKGVFDAMQRKYLHKIIFGIYLDPDQDTNLIESYNFTITYPNDEISLSCERIDALSISKSAIQQTYLNKADIKDSTTTMIRRLMCMTQTLNPLPKNRYITLRLIYYPHTPADYEPPFFSSADPNEHIDFVADPVQMTIGDVKTPFHGMKLKVFTATDQLDNLNAPQAEVKRTPAAINSVAPTPQDMRTGKQVAKKSDLRPVAVEHKENSASTTSAPNEDSDEFTQDETSHQDRIQLILNAIRAKKVDPTEEAIRAKYFNYPTQVLEAVIKTLPQPTKRAMATSSEVTPSGSTAPKPVPASAPNTCPTTPQTPRARVIGSSEVNVKLELAKLYKRALEATLSETTVSSKKLQREMAVGSKMADELLQKMTKDGCIKVSGAKFRGRDVDKEQTKKMLEQVDVAIKAHKKSESAPVTPKDLKRRREDDSADGPNKMSRTSNGPRCSVAKTSTKLSPAFEE